MTPQEAVERLERSLKTEGIGELSASARAQIELSLSGFEALSTIAAPLQDPFFMIGAEGRFESGAYGCVFALVEHGGEPGCYLSPRSILHDGSGARDEWAFCLSNAQEGEAAKLRGWLASSAARAQREALAQAIGVPAARARGQKPGL